MSRLMRLKVLGMLSEIAWRNHTKKARPKMGPNVIEVADSFVRLRKLVQAQFAKEAVSKTEYEAAMRDLKVLLHAGANTNNEAIL